MAESFEKVASTTTAGCSLRHESEGASKTCTQTLKEEGDIYRPLTGVKCHTDLLTLSEKMAAGTPNDMTTKERNDDDQLAELAADIAYTVMESAIFEIQTIKWQDGNCNNRDCDNRKAKLHKEQIAEETVDKRVHSITKQAWSFNDAMNNDEALCRINQESGDGLCDTRPMTQSISESYETDALKCSGSSVEEEAGAHKLNDLRTTASTLPSDFVPSQEMPTITLTNPEGEEKCILQSVVSPTMPSAVAENYSPHISIEQTGVSQASLTRDDTLNSSSASEPQVTKSYERLVESQSERTEDTCSREGCPLEKSSLSCKISSCMLHAKHSDLSVSQGSRLEEVDSDEKPQIQKSAKEDTSLFGHLTNRQKCFDVSSSPRDSAIVTSVTCYERAASTLSDQNTFASDGAFSQRAKSNEKFLGSDASDIQRKQDNSCDVDEDFLLAEAEAAFFAEMEKIRSPTTAQGVDVPTRQPIDGKAGDGDEPEDTLTNGSAAQKKSKPITTDWVSAKPFRPRKPAPPTIYNQAFYSNRPSNYDGSSRYFNNNNCHDRSQTRQHIVSLDGEYNGQELNDSSDGLEYVGEDNIHDEVQDIIVLPDQRSKHQQPPFISNNIRPPRFRPPPPRFYSPNHGPPGFHRPPFHPPNQHYGPPRYGNFHQPPAPNHTRPPFYPSRPMRPPHHSAKPPYRHPLSMVPPPDGTLRHHAAPPFSPPSHPNKAHFHSSYSSPAEEFDQVCNFRDGYVPYKEIDGCCYFDPSYLPDKPPPGLEYGYPQRGKRRKAVRLSSRFPTQAGKFHHHANFYVRNCAETAMSNPHDAN